MNTHVITCGARNIFSVACGPDHQLALQLHGDQSVRSCHVIQKRDIQELSCMVVNANEQKDVHLLGGRQNGAEHLSLLTLAAAAVVMTTHTST
jgi:hypothetical protein